MPTKIEMETMESIILLNRKIPEVELRDLFAMNAVNTLLRNTGLAWNDAMNAAVDTSYRIADAMIARRKVK